MKLKRKPPAGNVRRVQHIDGNTRYTITSKAGDTVQCESYLERKLVLQWERDQAIVRYMSQPEILTYIDEKGKSRTYVPDYKVWRKDGTIEIHEVTVEGRLKEKPILLEREKAAQAICKSRGMDYFRHTDKVLPNDTQLANLLGVYLYRPRGFSNIPVVTQIKETLIPHKAVLFNPLVDQISQDLNISIGVVNSTLLHMLWHVLVEIDWQKLLFTGYTRPAADTRIWLT